MRNGKAAPQPRPVRLIGVASGCGVPAALRGGAARAAAVLARADVGAGIRRNGIACTFDRVEPPAAPAPVPNDALLQELCAAAAARVAAALAAGDLPVVLSGDHALAVGTWTGVAAAHGKAAGLLWIDAHLDAHSSADSPTGNAHGMPLATLLGAEPNPWGRLRGLLDPARVCVLGARSCEDSEWRRLDALGVRIVSNEEVRARGLLACFAEALRHVAAAGSFGISLDLDAIDPQAAPGVNTPVAGGLDARELAVALHGLALREPGLLAIEITEFNPDADDRDGRTAALVATLLASLTAKDRQGWRKRAGGA